MRFYQHKIPRLHHYQFFVYELSEAEFRDIHEWIKCNVTAFIEDEGVVDPDMVIYETNHLFVSPSSSFSVETKLTGKSGIFCVLWTVRRQISIDFYHLDDMAMLFKLIWR